MMISGVQDRDKDQDQDKDQGLGQDPSLCL